MDDTLKVILTVIGTLLSGATAAKYVEWRSQKERNKLDELSLQRKELREDNRKLEDQVDQWRDKYYELKDKTMDEEREAQAKLMRVELENVQLKERNAVLERQAKPRREPKE
jgi:predicted nuclease with TOPRIM domain